MFLFLLACGGSPSPTDAIQDTETETPKDTGERDPIRDLDPSVLPSSPDPCRAPEVVLVKEIIDGDTLKVEGKWGGETVRLIGIDTPEMNYDNNAPECWAPEALAALEELLLDKWAWLAFDTECEDHFDRTLAYVHRGTEITDFIQRSLLRDGHAEAFKVNPNNNFHPLFEADESYADGKDLGMWGNCP
jgi:endonuclease YncB( thermonuclease family)